MDTTETVTPEAPKAKPSRSPRGAKTPKAKPSKRPLKLSLPVDVIAKLQLHALQEGVSVSGLVSRLSRDHLNEWTIHRTPSRSSD